MIAREMRERTRKKYLANGTHETVEKIFEVDS
jgi:hypothetical protein